MRPPAPTIRRRQHETTRKPHENVEVRTARLVSLADPNEATRDAATTKPLAHATDEETNITNMGRDVGTVSESEHQATEPKATEQGIHLEQPSRGHHRTTHATKPGTVRVTTEPDTRRINSTRANGGRRGLC